MTPVADAMFTLIKPNIDSATQRYEASVENGKKGGRPRKNENLEKPNNNLAITQEKPKNNLKQPSNNLNDNVNDNDNDNYNYNYNADAEKKEKESATPSLSHDEVMYFYLNNINSTPVPKEVELLSSFEKDLPKDLIIFAMEKAVENKARNLGYIKGILNKWQQKGITTLAEAKDEVKNKASPKAEATNKFHDTTSQYGDLSRFYVDL